jgi:hypothetical protein
MESMTVAGLTLFFDPEEREAAGLISRACERSVQINHEYWGLDTPEDLRVYVMTSWRHMVFHSAPGSWRILLAIAMPLWAPRARRMWPYVGGWEQRYGKRATVGIKPPRLMEAADRSIGERIFVPLEPVEERVRSVTCHELNHAFVAHLRPPAWLKEGLAMISVDQFFGKMTVRPETLASLKRPSQQAGAQSYRQVRVTDPDAAVYQYVRGYWVTRFLDETRPDLLRSLLVRRQRHEELEGEVAAAFDLGREEFWDSIDRMVVSHFGQEDA